MKRSLAITMSIAFALSATGCAKPPRSIVPSYVSPLQYQGYDCAQITAEAQRIQGRVTQLGGRLDQAATNDKVLTGIGFVVFWPALLALGGTGQEEAEYARLKGEYDALQQAAIAKKCDGVVALAEPRPPTPTSKPKETTY